VLISRTDGPLADGFRSDGITRPLGGIPSSSALRGRTPGLRFPGRFDRSGTDFV